MLHEKLTQIHVINKLLHYNSRYILNKYENIKYLTMTPIPTVINNNSSIFLNKLL